MTSQQIKDIQEKFVQLQQQIKEVVLSPEKDIKVILDGNVQIIDIEIISNKNIEQLKPALIETINIGIKSVSEKIKTIMIALQTEMQNNIQSL